MFNVKLRRRGNSYVVTIPPWEIERLQLREGDAVELEIRPALAADLRQALDRELGEGEDALRYLAEH